jgi:ABC-type multidrug transport system fused ATPase/permease subunit
MQNTFTGAWPLLAAYLRPQRLRFAALALLLLGSIGLELLNPQILRAFLDGALAGAAPELLLRTALLFIGVALAHQVVAVLARYASEQVGWSATNALRGDLAEHCLRLDLAFHKARTPGELIERVDGDVTALASFFSRLTVNVLGNLLLLLGALALLFREDWRAGLAITLFALAMLWLLNTLRSIGVPFWAAEREASAQFFGFLSEQLSSTEDVRGNGASAYVMRRFSELLRAWLPFQRRGHLSGYSLWMGSTLMFAIGNAVALGLGAYLWSRGEISLGTVYLLFSYTELLRRPIDEIRSELQELQRALASIGRIQELLRLTPQIRPRADRLLPPGALSVAFEQVIFAYADQPPTTSDEGRRTKDEGPGAESQDPGAGQDSQSTMLNTQLHEVSFGLEPGEVLGLLGRTGSGKSTVARLLLRLYDPDSGAVRLGGVDLRDVRTESLRQRVGVVTQDVQLFQGSVRDNLTFYNRAIPDARIREALDTLGLLPWLDSLPSGLDTELASGGGGLSAGEAQLLAFARALLHDPGLVILDEASARLDPATERLIERAVERLLRGRTAVIIAHRLSTVQRADTIILLESGQIAEHGPRARLAADPGSRFAALLRAGLETVDEVRDQGLGVTG